MKLKFLCFPVPAVFVLLLCSALPAVGDERRAQLEAKPLLAAVWIELGGCGGKEVVIALEGTLLQYQVLPRSTGKAPVARRATESGT